MGGHGVPRSDRYELAASPIHRAMAEPDLPTHLFDSDDPQVAARARAAMDGSLAVVRQRVGAGTAYGDDDNVAPDVLGELSGAGYWGLRADVEYGGSGVNLAGWAPFIAETAVVDPWIAALSSPHAALGPVNLVARFGTDEQKARLLPPLAAGERLGAFAITEPGTASDWGAIGTTAVRSGDELLLCGEKMFITNAAPGRTVAVLCKLDGRLTMLVVELPSDENDRFHTVRYHHRAPRHITNRALIFRDLPVPAANILEADGRAVGYHGLNHGRVLVCAFAAGGLRAMAGILIPWVQTRATFGAVIGRRELVQRRLGRLAGRIVAADALVAWSAQVLDQGYRGELECVTAKVFGSEAMKDAAVDLLLKTHGSRAFIPGNLFADALHDLVAPTIFEGENEVLTLGSFRSLVKARLSNPPSAGVPPAAPRGMPPLDLDELAAFAAATLRQTGSEVDDAVRQHGAALAERQAIAVELAQRAQLATVLLVVARYGARQTDALVRQAAVCITAELAQRLSGARPTPAYHQLLTDLGAAVADEAFAPVAGATRIPVAIPDRVDNTLPTRA
jgi:alkylation response protein AidB-like acyl-CoA dehydrogenase